jgi:2,3-bisphosphoglycerate-independent phosphoglycerate mutase
MPPKPVVLCILDGWGVGDTKKGNAPALAHTPTFDRIMRDFPNSTLITHGPDVGLPTGQMGNSEVGHMNIGAGRVVAMDLGQIDLAIESGAFEKNPSLISFINTLKETGGTAHLMGVVSDGGVHGHISHLAAALQALNAAEIPTVLHLFTDGRDVPPSSAMGYLQSLKEQLPDGVKIGTLIGRYYAMDRDNRWERVKTAHDAIIHGTSQSKAATAHDAVEQAYGSSLSDEFIPATVLGDYKGVNNGDGVFFLNFRADRAREILSALADPGFDAFPTDKRPRWASVLGMVNYSNQHDEFMSTCFPKQEIVNTLGAWVAQHGKRQFRLAETEKYPHVTFFLNGGKEPPENNEERFMPKSPAVATYDMQPEMSAPAVTKSFVAAIEKRYDLIITNFANPDMVGHTGDLEAAKKACSAVDAGLAEIMKALEKTGGTMILTADHGNCEVMIDPETGAPHTAHTLNPVPVALVGASPDVGLRDGGRLADLAPTLLDLMQLDAPEEMTGKSLLTR